MKGRPSYQESSGSCRCSCQDEILVLIEIALCPSSQGVEPECLSTACRSTYVEQELRNIGNSLFICLHEVVANNGKGMKLILVQVSGQASRGCQVPVERICLSCLMQPRFKLFEVLRGSDAQPSCIRTPVDGICPLLEPWVIIQTFTFITQHCTFDISKINEAAEALPWLCLLILEILDFRFDEKIFLTASWVFQWFVVTHVRVILFLSAWFLLLLLLGILFLTFDEFLPHQLGADLCLAEQTALHLKLLNAEELYVLKFSSRHMNEEHALQEHHVAVFIS